NNGNPPVPPLVQSIQSWSMDFSGLTSITSGASAFPGLEGETGGTFGFGTDVALTTTIGQSPSLIGAIETIPGGPLGDYPVKASVAPVGTPGVPPTFSVSIDNTLGSFSPFQGRVYVAYTRGPARPPAGTNPDPPEPTNIYIG